MDRSFLVRLVCLIGNLVLWKLYIQPLLEILQPARIDKIPVDHKEPDDAQKICIILEKAIYFLDATGYFWVVISSDRKKIVLCEQATEVDQRTALLVAIEQEEFVIRIYRNGEALIDLATKDIEWVCKEAEEQAKDVICPRVSTPFALAYLHAKTTI